MVGREDGSVREATWTRSKIKVKVKPLRRDAVPKKASSRWYTKVSARLDTDTDARLTADDLSCLRKSVQTADSRTSWPPS